MSEHSNLGEDHPKLPAEAGKKLVNIALAALGASVLVAGGALAADRHRFMFAYLAGFVFVVTIGLGALFFVVLQHLVHAGWSVAARRHMEWVAGVLPWTAVLFLPVAVFAHDIFPWMGHEAHVEAVEKKAAYLNPTFFFIRAAVYFIVWSALSVWFSRNSRAQDKKPDPSLTLRMQWFAAPAMMLFAFSLTFAGFDWLMSLQPEWYSTIFGVYVFAGSVTSSLALLSLITIGLQTSGLLSRVSNEEHRHEIGKLLFAFVVFWAYIAFSQYFLIWYANIPEETSFYRARWGEGWKTISLVLAAIHFPIPFVLLLSRELKRSIPMLSAMAVVVLLAHAVDMYWLVMPIADASGTVSWVDVAAWLPPAATLFLVVARQMADGPLFPINDPRLAEAAQLSNP